MSAERPTSRPALQGDVDARSASIYRVDHTWLAYAFDEPVHSERLAGALARVVGHYQEVVDFPLQRRGGEGRLGVVVWDHPDPACAWPLWSADAEVEVGYAYVPTGVERLLGTGPPHDPIRLGRELLRDPTRARDLDSPLAAAILDRPAGRLTILNDALGLARLYEMRFEDGWVWSNRLGALPLFAGVAPEADERGWALLAASGWFMGGSTAIRGTQKLAPGTVVEADADGVRRRQSGATERIVAPGEEPLPELVEAAAEQAIGVVDAVARLWPEPLVVELTGGRDSRVSAAATLAAGVDRAVFVTRNLVRGETDFVSELLAASPREHPHTITSPPAELQPDILERARWSHLVHDGMRSPESVHAAQELPAGRTAGAVLTGHVGGVSHGEFYVQPRFRRAIRRRGENGPGWRLTQRFQPALDAARESVGVRLRDEIADVLRAGRSLDLEGLVLLDYFHLTDFMSHWADLPAGGGRYAVFGTPAFLRASFRVTPRQRVRDVLHRRLTARLVPEWSELPYFAPQGPPRWIRPRLWQRPNDAAAFERVLAEDSRWEDLYDPPTIREMWLQAKQGGATTFREKLFERIVFRVAFDDHLRLLAKRATESP